MSSFLSIEEYNTLELDAIRCLPNLVNAAFAPLTFARANFPLRARFEDEFVKYVDAMQEQRAPLYLSEFLGGMTHDEFCTFRLLVEQIAEFSQKNFNRRLGGWSSLLQCLSIARQIKLVTDEKRLRVLELGPGCGYLALILAYAGHSHFSTDVTQGFYLYQNRILNFSVPDKVVETARSSLSTAALQRLLDTPEMCIHMPWWQFAEMYKAEVPQFDLVTCNHMLAEMHPDSLSYSVKLASMMLKSSSIGLVVFEGWGWNISSSYRFVVEQFYKHNFVIVHSDRLVTVFAQRDRCQPKEFQKPEAMISGTGISWGNGMVYSNETINEFIPQEGAAATGSILKKRESFRRNITVPPQEVVSFYESKIGADQIFTENEIFWRFVGHPLQ